MVRQLNSPIKELNVVETIELTDILAFETDHKVDCLIDIIDIDCRLYKHRT